MSVTNWRSHRRSSSDYETSLVTVVNDLLSSVRVTSSYKRDPSEGTEPLAKACGIDQEQRKLGCGALSIIDDAPTNRSFAAILASPPAFPSRRFSPRHPLFILYFPSSSPLRNRELRPWNARAWVCRSRQRSRNSTSFAGTTTCHFTGYRPSGATCNWFTGYAIGRETPRVSMRRTIQLNYGGVFRRSI